MFSPSDFNNAVPQFSHGSYASNPLSPLYIEEPSSANYNNGVAPLQTLPAQWWNWLCNQFTAKLNKINVYVKNIFDELTNLLSLVGVTPNAAEGGVITSGQIKDAFETKYPNYISKFIHTLAELWSYTETVIVGDVTTTQTSRLAIFEHVNTSDTSTTPATETDEYKTKYVDKLPVGLGGTNANNVNDAMVNLVDPLTTVAQNAGLITDEVVFERNDNGVKSVQKMGLSEVGRIVSSTHVNMPIISASSTTINSISLNDGESIKVLFTADISGSDTTTGMSILYNGTTTPVKVAKNGSLIDFTAKEIDTNIFKYLQAYTTLELYYDGINSYFIIMNNPIVLSSADYEIYANGYNGQKILDWNNAQSINISTTGTTITNDGWLIGVFLRTTEGRSYLYLNNIIIATSLSLPNTKAYANVQIEIHKGDILRYDTASYSLTFVPYKKY